MNSQDCKHSHRGWLHREIYCRQCSEPGDWVGGPLWLLTPTFCGPQFWSRLCPCLAGWPQAGCFPSLSISFQMMTETGRLITTGSPTSTFSNLSILSLHPKPHSQRPPPSWQLEALCENLVLVLAGSPPHIHPFQFKHAGGLWVGASLLVPDGGYFLWSLLG